MIDTVNITEHARRLLVALQELDGPAATLALAAHVAGLSGSEGLTAFAELETAGLAQRDGR